MTMNFARRPLVAALLAILWLGILSGKVSAQLPRIEAIADNHSVCQCVCVLEEQPDRPIYVLDETESSALVRFFRDAEWYFSWGYSREWWARTNIHVSQPFQGNNFTIYNLRGNDDPSWGSVFSSQYNIRLGRFIDDARTLAVEFNMDHTKYTSVIGQTARVAGSVAGKPTDANYLLDSQFFTYNLHNGANHIMFNLVKRVPLIGEPNERFSVAAIGKVGVGFLAPHPENIIMGQLSDVGKKDFNNMIGVHQGWWRVDGWTTGIEAGFRVGLTSRLYFEITDKVAFARLGDVPVYQGTASHNLWMNEVILSVGITLGGRR